MGTNPRWDRSEEDDRSPGTDDEAGDASSDDASAVGSSESTSAASGGDSGDSSDGDAPTCEPGQALCAGACTEIAMDKHACGLECIDCTTLFGSDARCRDGACESKDDGEDDGD